MLDATTTPEDQTPNPSDDPTFEEVEEAFVENHWYYGGLAHKVTADALVKTLAEPSEPEIGHVIFARLFSEYAASLETLGSWGWAIANRKTKGSLMKAFLSVRTNHVGDFYRRVQADEGDVVDLLDLPSREDAHAAIAKVAGTAEIDFSIDEYEKSLETRYRNLKNAADQWFDDDRVIMEAYNKAKHGAALVRLFGSEDPRRFQIVLFDKATEEMRFANFTVTKELVLRMQRNVEAVTVAITELVGLVKILRDAGLLYE